MIMADILKILLIVLGILTIYVSYWLLAEALFPLLVERASQHYRRPFRITFVGCLAAAVPVGLGFVLANLPNPILKVFGITLLVTPAMLGLVGSAGLTLRIGAGLPSPVDEGQPWRKVLRGGVVLACAFLLPVVGWVVLPIWVLVSGFGALVLCFKEQSRTQPSSGTTAFVPANQVPG
jgi:hypothetical protein